MNLPELARDLLPLAAPASFVHSQIIGPEELEDELEGDVDEWVALDAAVAARIAGAGNSIVLRWPARDLRHAPRLQRVAIEAVVDGDDELAVAEVAAALAAGLQIRALVASGETGIDCYRAAAAARRALGMSLPIRARWDGILDVKGAALALTFGADELAGPLAPEKDRRKLAQIGGPAEDGMKPSPIYVESLITAAGRQPCRGRK
jgi:hypothetical protein